MQQATASAGTIEPVTPEDLAQVPEFAEIPGKEWERLLKFYDLAIVRRRFKPGDIVCREGEYTYTAFFIVSGKAKVFLSSPLGHVNTVFIGSDKKPLVAGGGATRMDMRMTAMLNVAKLAEQEDKFTRGFIPIDATVDLSLEKRENFLEAGSLFGEMSCLSLYPRSATVQVVDECVMFEMHRNVLETLKKKGKKFKALIETSYRERALSNHLRSSPEFCDLPVSYINHLKSKVELLAYEPGDVIISEGAPGEHFYLVRIGFVQVAKKYPGGELVLSYMSRGQYFGELALLTNQASRETYKALDHVEVVRFDKAEFDYMTSHFTEVGHKLRETARRRAVMQPSAVPSTIELRLNNLLEQGLMDAQNVLMIDLDSCTRCDECVHACAEAHEGVTRLIRDGLRFDNFLVATSCRQCTDPMCMIGCPVGSIRRRDSLEVIIEDWCIGCDKCAKSCPYGNISMHEFDVTKLDKVYDGQKVIEKEGPRGRKQAVVRKATTCDLCLDLPEPSCVYACPHNAAIRGNPSEIAKQRESSRKAVKTSSSAFIPLARLSAAPQYDLPDIRPKTKWFSFPWRRTPKPKLPNESPPAPAPSDPAVPVAPATPSASTISSASTTPQRTSDSDDSRWKRLN